MRVELHHRIVLTAAIALFASQCAPSPAQARQTVLDRVVAVVNNQAILQSDLQEDLSLAVLDPNEAGLGVLTPQMALQQLIGRALIEQQIRQQDISSVDPSPAEIAARLHEIRTELPACVHANCASDQGWKNFLAAHGLALERVESYLRYRLQILNFIELRFRQGIQISPQEVEGYYRETLLPQYKPGEAKPALAAVSPRIEEILLQKKVNALFETWLNNLRSQGDVEVLDPALAEPQPAVKTGGGSK